MIYKIQAAPVQSIEFKNTRVSLVHPAHCYVGAKMATKQGHSSFKQQAQMGLCQIICNLFTIVSFNHVKYKNMQFKSNDNLNQRSVLNYFLGSRNNYDLN